MLYFAYGSNMDEDQMNHRCPFAEKIATGFLSDHKLIISHKSKKWAGGVLSVKPETSKKVWGAIYDITQSDLDNLDYYEGWPKVYSRKILKVNVVNDLNQITGTKDCYVYFANKVEEGVKPSEDYLDLVKEAHEKNKTPFLLDL